MASGGCGWTCYARASRAALIRVMLPKLLAPLTDRFGRDDDVACEQEFFNVSITQTKTEVQPDTTADDLRWEAVVFVGVGWCGSVHGSLTTVDRYQERAVLS